MTIDVISLGCSKNLVDSERLLYALSQKGYTMRHDPEEPSGDYVVVNTCGFIGDAKEESINMLLELGELKQQGRIGKIVVMGCLSERYREELREAVPEVDIWYGKFDWKAFIADLPDLSRAHKPVKEWERQLTTNPWSAYLKISEGCNRFCAFCAIPLITGRHTSRPIEEIVEEAMRLASEGVKELNVIAQDLSSYGTDRYGRHALAELVQKLSEIDGIEWIRLHYAYPSDFPEDLLPVMRDNPKVAKYLDIALQHISTPVLTAMRRHIDKEQTLRLLEKLRREVPGIKIRTTMMVGFPGETEEDFQELLEFVKEQRFERLGAFAYCEEEDTYAANNLQDNVPEEVKQQRLNHLMKVQEEISASLNEEMVGQRVKVLVDREEGRFKVGRTQWDSPEVDQEVFVCDCQARPGEFVEVEITGSEEFDLYAKPV